MALLAVVLSCYPILFFGKSFVSPNFGGIPLLYAAPPSVPGLVDLEQERSQGSDYGATMWQSLPGSVIESRALFQDGELPLWNRYNSGGLPLLGQGISMLGDPLHNLVLLAGGAPWAWDLKYLLAKLLFCAGVGFAVRAITREHLAATLLLTFSSAFLGFFSYRFNHPAFFSFCYAPWILACWLRVAQATSLRAATGWMAGLLLAHWAELTSGAIKEAAMLIAGLDLCGFLACRLATEPTGLKRRKFLHLAAAGALLALLSAPLWLTFLQTLAQSATVYDLPKAYQIQPGLLIGLFDDIFYRPFNRAEQHFNPSANFLVLIGCLFALVRLSVLMRDPFGKAVCLSAIVPLVLVFGIVPPSMVAALPFLGRIEHIDNTFSCVLIIHLLVLAGLGFQQAWQSYAGISWKRDRGLVAGILVVLLAVYLGTTHAAQRSAINFVPIGREILKSDFWYGYTLTLIASAIGLLWLGRRLVRSRSVGLPTLLAAGVCLFLIHWRHGMHWRTPYDNFVVNPKVRADLLAPSPAVDFVRAKALQNPARAVGFDSVLFPGFNAALGLESIYGPDALFNPAYREFVEAAKFKMFWGWGITVDKQSLATLHRAYDMLNVRYYLDAAKGAGPSLPPGFASALDAPDLTVFESKTSWPRAFFTDRLRYCNGAAGLVEQLNSGDGQPFAAVEEDTLKQRPELKSWVRDDSADRQLAPAHDYRLTGNRTSFRIDAPGAGIVVLSEVFLDGDIQASVNGIATPVFRVNHAFRGVLIDRAGPCEVSFSYWPRRFTLMLWLAAAGAVLLPVWFWLGFRSRAGQV